MGHRRRWLHPRTNTDQALWDESYALYEERQALKKRLEVVTDQAERDQIEARINEIQTRLEEIAQELCVERQDLYQYYMERRAAVRQANRTFRNWMNRSGGNPLVSLLVTEEVLRNYRPGQHRLLFPDPPKGTPTLNESVANNLQGIVGYGQDIWTAMVEQYEQFQQLKQGFTNTFEDIQEGMVGYFDQALRAMEAAVPQSVPNQPDWVGDMGIHDMTTAELIRYRDALMQGGDTSDATFNEIDRVNALLEELEYSDENLPLHVKQRLWAVQARMTKLQGEVSVIQGKFRRGEISEESARILLDYYADEITGLRGVVGGVAWQYSIGNAANGLSEVAYMSTGEKFITALQMAIDSGQIDDATVAKLQALLSPENLPQMAAFMAGIAALHATPFGIAADAGLIAKFGSDAVLVMQRVYLAVDSAQDEQGLADAANEITNAMSSAAVEGVVNLLTWGAAKGVGKAGKYGMHRVKDHLKKYEYKFEIEDIAKPGTFFGGWPIPRIRFTRTPRQSLDTHVWDKSVEWTAPKGTGQTYTVYMRNDIDWDFVRPNNSGALAGRGMTNAEAAAKHGLGPILPDGKVATLHHSQQNSTGSLFEASTRYHHFWNADKAPLHPFGFKQHPFFPMGNKKDPSSPRSLFQNHDSIDYWKWRGQNHLEGN